MNRAGWERYIAETYSAEAEFPWVKYPNYAVFRHSGSRKWFALMLDVPKRKLGLEEDGVLDLLNVKCDPLMIGSFRAEPGIYPAYHMNKAGWLSVALDGSVGEETVRTLLDLSFDLTARRGKRRKAPPGHGETDPIHK